MAKEGYSAFAPSLERTQCYVNRNCCCAFAHAFGVGEPHPPLARSPFPSRGRLCCVSKFYVNITEVGRNRILTIRIRISRQCSPQARPLKFDFTGMPAAGATIGIRFYGNVRRRRDHRNSISRECSPQARPPEFDFTGMPAAGAATDLLRCATLGEGR